MTKNTERIGNREKAILHVAKAELGLSDEIYRALLKEIAGVTSSVDLDRAKYQEVLEELKKKGFRVRLKKHKGKKFDELGHRPGMASPKQLRLIDTLWLEVSRSKDPKRALRLFLFGHFGASDLRMVDIETAGKVIEALKAMKARATKKATG